MRIQKLVALLIGLCLGLAFLVLPAQAGDADRSDNLVMGDILVSVEQGASRWSSTSVVLYDENWVALEEVETYGRAHKFTAVKAGSYHVAAYSDQAGDWMAEAVDVQPAQTAHVRVNLKTQADWLGVPVRVSTCSGGATGDGRFLKIAPSYGQQIIYMQCGRVVGKAITTGGCPSCGGASGGWRYVNDCVKVAPIYVNLPCPRN